MRYYDIHTHNPDSRPEDVAIISIDLINPCISDKLCYSVGVHPWLINYNQRDTTNLLFEKVRDYAYHPAIVAIGETGLDKLKVNNPNDYLFQQTLFTSHVSLAEEVQKPLIIHCVKAWDALFNIRQAVKPSMPWIIHGFRGKELLALRLIQAGFYLSFGLHYHIEALKIAWKYCRLLIETDDNQINISDVYHQIASDLNITVTELTKEIGELFVLVFNYCPIFAPIFNKK